MEALTRRQAEILQMIRAVVERDGRPPTRAEIATHFKFKSVNAAEAHLRALARKGAIELVSGASRGIRLLSGLIPDEGIPIVGRVAAGQPILAEQHLEEHYPLAGELFKPAADYLLRVRGMSMRDEGIIDGDLLAVHSTRVATSGQLVVARVDGEVTVKRFSRDRDRVTLNPANQEFDPIVIDLRTQELEIEGIGVGVIRPTIEQAADQSS